MSEYWKSTPKYWCKHCKTYVRDSKLERTQHEATGRHQGNLKRFIRDLHRGHEREEREKDRAKHEVERLNGVVSGSVTEVSNDALSGAQRRRETTYQPMPPSQRQATAQERMKQMAQLAEMGVAVPQEFRGDMAMAGEWQTISETILTSNNEDGKESKERSRTSGVQKRKYPGQDDDDEADESARRTVWGSTTKVYPSSQPDNTDLDALLGSNKPLPQSHYGGGPSVGMAHAEKAAEGRTSDLTKQALDNYDDTSVKTEPFDAQTINPPVIDGEPHSNQVEATGRDHKAGEVLFKKRKSKNIRQK